jgi:hypothetical protein
MIFAKDAQVGGGVDADADADVIKLINSGELKKLLA